MANPKCAACGKTVYPMEKVSSSKLAWHKLCFKCSTCNIKVSLANHKVAGGALYCAKCEPKVQHTPIADSLDIKRATNAPRRAKVQGLKKDARMTFVPGKISASDIDAAIAAEEAMGGYEPAATSTADEPAATGAASSGGLVALDGAEEYAARMKAQAEAFKASMPAVQKLPSQAGDSDAASAPAAAAAGGEGEGMARRAAKTVLDHYYELFTQFDADDSGGIDAGELGAMFAKCNVPATDTEIQGLIARVDENNNGTIEFPEFCAMIKLVRSGEVTLAGLAGVLGVEPAEKKEQLPEGHARRAAKTVLDHLYDLFSEIDADGSGAIDAAELGALFEKCNATATPEELQELIAKVDENNNGTIEFPEFLQMMKLVRSGEHKLAALSGILGEA